MVDSGKLAESRRWWGWSRPHCLFFILVIGVVSYFYSTNIKDMARDWKPKLWIHYNTTKWRVPFIDQRLNVVSPNMTVPSASTPGRASEPNVSAGITTQTSASAFNHSVNGNIRSLNVSDMTTVPRQTTSASVEIQQMTQNKPAPPIPYISPGPYLVEYPYDYHFILNEPKKCEQQKTFLVLMVPVAPHNRAHRDVVRSTWGGESLVGDKVVTLFFLLGLHTGEGAEQLQEKLLLESKEHRDLIQSDFLDCYKNLTIKTMVMLEWLDTHCSSASYAMKIDSDMFLNVPKLIGMFSNYKQTNYMSGLVEKGAAVLRDPKSKWYVPVEIYPYPHYPCYALGLGYVLSLDLPKKLVEASRHVKALYIEDVYLGLCMQHLGISPTDPPNRSYFNVFPVAYSRCTYSRLVATTTHEYADRVWVWKDFKRPGPYC